MVRADMRLCLAAIFLLLLEGPVMAERATPPIDQSVRAARLASPHIPQTPAEARAAAIFIMEHEFELFAKTRPDALNFEEWLSLEWAAYLVWDADGDGRISRQEYMEMYCGAKTHPGACRFPPFGVAEFEKRFSGLDRANKGFLVKDDIRALAHQSFEANDLNRDGWVTKEEILEAARGPK